ncbi:MAG: hypothetical protein HKN11_12120 [Rhizobiales bacterium]|nr:hypothetical protein [Hyphomicrobiales bacterium]
MWEVDSITDYVMRGALSGDGKKQTLLTGQNSQKILFVHTKKLQAACNVGDDQHTNCN